MQINTAPARRRSNAPMWDALTKRFPDAAPEKVRKRIRAVMEFKGLNHKQMAELLGIPPTTFRENMRIDGNRRFDYMIVALCDLYELTSDYLYMGKTRGLPRDFQNYLRKNPNAGEERIGRGRTPNGKK